MTYDIVLELGDPSYDGHGHTATYYVKSSHDKEAIELAYANAVKLIGVDLVEEVAGEYEEDKLLPEHEKLMRLHLTRFFAEIDAQLELDTYERVDEPFVWEYDYTSVPLRKVRKPNPVHTALIIDVEDFVNLYLEYVRLGSGGSIVAEIAPADIKSTIEIGGYGLFGS